MELLKNKYLLLDTNLLINIAKKGAAFAPFLNDLEKLNVTSVIDRAIKFEFLRGCQNKEDLQGKEEYLDLLFGKKRFELPDGLKIFELATEISNFYTWKNNKFVKQISPIDCLIAAQMVNYNNGHKENNLFLATSDNYDFPLFDRLTIFTVDAGDKIVNIGIYGFNETSYNDIKKRFYT